MARDRSLRRSKTIYLAGPEVFLPDAVEVGARKKAMCSEYGFEGLFPFDNEAAAAAGRRTDRLIYEANVAMIRAADIGVFNLTPFRGPSADPGTVFELGMMAGLGKPCFGYTHVASDMVARVPDARRDAGGAWRDALGRVVEDFGNADNLMIDACLAAGGNGLARLDVGGRLDALDGFEACLRMAVSAMSGAHRRVAV